MKKLLFSITKDDLEFQTFRSGGKGGQNQNARDTGVRFIHRPSGAIGESREHRTQGQNKEAAFVRMANHPKMKAWCQKKAWEQMGLLQDIEHRVDKMMQEKNLKIEYYTP